MTSIHRSAGYQRFLREVITTIEQRGQWPKKKTLQGFTPAERADLLLALRSDCIKIQDDKIVVDLEGVLNEDFGGDRLSMEAAFTAWADRPIRPKRAAHEADRQQLLTWLDARPNPAARHLRAQLEHRRGWISAALGEGFQAAASQALAFLSIADRLPLEAPRRFRTLAREAGLPSKTLDPGRPLYRRLTSYLSRNEHEPMLSDDEEAVWRAAGLTRNMTAIHVLLHGDVRLAVNGIDIVPNTTPPSSIMLTWEQLESANLMGAPKQALFVENETSFIEARAELPPKTLLVFTEGYPNRAVTHLLGTLHLADVRCFHWGDIDGGGFRALRGLQKAGTVTPLHMDVHTLNAFPRETLDDAKRGAILRELEYWPAGPERAALESCLQLGEWLEQETIHPARVLKQLR